MTRTRGARQVRCAAREMGHDAPSARFRCTAMVSATSRDRQSITARSGRRRSRPIAIVGKRNAGGEHARDRPRERRGKCTEQRSAPRAQRSSAIASDMRTPVHDEPRAERADASPSYHAALESASKGRAGVVRAAHICARRGSGTNGWMNTTTKKTMPRPQRSSAHLRRHAAAERVVAPISGRCIRPQADAGLVGLCCLCGPCAGVRQSTVWRAEQKAASVPARRRRSREHATVRAYLGLGGAPVHGHRLRSADFTAQTPQDERSCATVMTWAGQGDDTAPDSRDSSSVSYRRRHARRGSARTSTTSIGRAFTGRMRYSSTRAPSNVVARLRLLGRDRHVHSYGDAQYEFTSLSQTRVEESAEPYCYVRHRDDAPWA